MKRTHLDLLLVGPFPPPVGGNSVHVQNLYELISGSCHAHILDPYGTRAANDTACVTRTGPPSITSALRLSCYLASVSARCIHTHVSSFQRFLWIAPLMTFLTSRESRRVLTIHSGSFADYLRTRRLIQKKLIKWVISAFDKIIVVNSEQAEALTSVLNISKQVIEVLPAFIPPQSKSGLVKQGKAFVELMDWARSTTPLLVSCGSGNPIYGFEEVLKAAECLEELSVILCIYGSQEKNYMDRVIATGREILGETRFRIAYDLAPEDFRELLKASDLFVRATDRDGDSVAIREALAIGIPVIASDATPRPNSVVIYRTGDTNDLTQSIKEQLLQEESARFTDKHHFSSMLEDVRTDLLSNYLRIYDMRI